MSYVYGAVSAEHDAPFAQESTLDSAVRAWQQGEDGRLVVLLHDPDEAEVSRLAETFELPELAVEDTMHGHQRPKLERYDHILFVVLHSVAYQEKQEKLTVGEVHVFVGPDFFIGIGHGATHMQGAIHQVERSFRKSHLNPRNPHCQLYFLFDSIVDNYEPILVSMDEDLDEIEGDLFSRRGTTQRIYELFNEVVRFQRATRPLTYMLELLMRGAEKYDMPDQLAPHFRDVRDHTIRASEHLDSLRSSLQNALNVGATLAAQDQNDATKALSGWGALLVIPTIIAGIYGMNFEHMPELSWIWGYPMAIGSMVVIDAILWVVFKKRGWL